MKNFLKLILFLAIILFSGSKSCAQKIITYRGDTLVVISPKTVATINSIIVEKKYLEEEVRVLSELNELKDSTITQQKEIINLCQQSIVRTTTYHDLKVQEIKIDHKKELWKWSGISAGIGLILGIIISQ